MVDKVLHAQMPFTTGKQTINDRLTAAYHSLAGSQLGKTVCKATTEEEIGPKKKHLDYLIHCTNEPNVSIPQLANLLIERTTSSNWCTVYKSLISIHNLMCYGNERFSQYLASSNANFNLVSFLDKTSVQGYDMSTHVRRYAKYIGEKIFTYRMMAFDFCKVKRGREDGLLRTMPTERLLKTLPLLQGQIDSLLEFQVSSSDLTNGVINSCFILLFRDLIRLFACYNDGVINLLEKYFDMNKKQCRDALELYKNFLTRMDKVAEFLKVAESVGIDKCEIPDLARAPSSLIEALEQHLASLEGQKAPSAGPGSRVTSPTSGPSLATQSTIQKLSSAGGFASPVVDPTVLDEQARMKILQEEEQRLNMLKEQRLRELQFMQQDQQKRPLAQGLASQGQLVGPKTNPFLQASVAESSAKSSSIDDLLSLDFSAPAATNQISTSTNQISTSTNPFQSGPFGQPPAVSSPFVSTASYANGHTINHTGSSFASDDAFSRAFTSSDAMHSGGLDGPSMTTTQQKQQVKSVNTGKVIKGDLDSSLASLAENLNISKSQDALKNKPVQWSQQKQPGIQYQQQQFQASYGSNLGYGYQQPMAAPSWGQQAPVGTMPTNPPSIQYYNQPMSMFPGQLGATGSGYSMPASQHKTTAALNAGGATPADPFGTL